MTLKAYLRINPDGTQRLYWEEGEQLDGVHDKIQVDDHIELDGDGDSPNALIKIVRDLADGHPYIECKTASDEPRFMVDGDGDVMVRKNLLMMPNPGGGTGAIATPGLISLQGNGALIFTPYDDEGYPMTDCEFRLGRSQEIGDASHDNDGLEMKWKTSEVLITPIPNTPAIRVTSTSDRSQPFLQFTKSAVSKFKVSASGDITSNQMSFILAEVDALGEDTNDLRKRVTTIETKPDEDDDEDDDDVEGHRRVMRKAVKPTTKTNHTNLETLTHLVNTIQGEIGEIETEQGLQEHDIKAHSDQMTVMRNDITTLQNDSLTLVAPASQDVSNPSSSKQIYDYVQAAIASLGSPSYTTYDFTDNPVRFRDHDASNSSYSNPIEYEANGAHTKIIIEISHQWKQGSEAIQTILVSNTSLTASCIVKVYMTLQTNGDTDYRAVSFGYHQLQIDNVRRVHLHLMHKNFSSIEYNSSNDDFQDGDWWTNQMLAAGSHFIFHIDVIEP